MLAKGSKRLVDLPVGFKLTSQVEVEVVLGIGVLRSLKEIYQKPTCSKERTSPPF